MLRLLCARGGSRCLRRPAPARRGLSTTAAPISKFDLESDPTLAAPRGSGDSFSPLASLRMAQTEKSVFAEVRRRRAVLRRLRSPSSPFGRARL